MTQTVQAGEATKTTPFDTSAILPSDVIPPHGSLHQVPVSRIRKNRNIDPRKHRNQTRLAEIRDTVDEKGVIQAITIRPVPVDENGTDLEVVAGNTRFDLCVEVGHIYIPALVLHIDDIEAADIAAMENTQRVDLSEVEEGFLAAKKLKLMNNDHAAVLRVLRWSRSKLDARLLLTHVSEFIQNAVVQGQLKNGHVQLLASVPDEEDQDYLANKIIENKYSVREARKRLALGKSRVSEARFNTAECVGCRFNSDTTSDLFPALKGEEKGLCSNAKCWSAKTNAALDLIVSDAKESYHIVHLDSEIPEDSSVILEEAGEAGIGVEQKKGCLSCVNYGAVISTVFGKEGVLTDGVCFNLECHAQKVTAHRTAVQKATQQPSMRLGAAHAVTSPAAQSASNDDMTQDAVEPKAASGVAAVLSPDSIKKGIKREATQRFRTMGEVAIGNSECIGLAISLLTLHKSLNHYRDYEKDVGEKADRILSDLEDAAREIEPFNSTVGDNQTLLLSRLPASNLVAAITKLAALTVWEKDRNDSLDKHPASHDAARYTQAMNIDRSQYLAVTPGYVKAQTKPGIVQDCLSSGLAAAYDAVNGEKAFEKLSTARASDFIKEIQNFVTEGGFDWKGYEPLGFNPAFYYENI